MDHKKNVQIIGGGGHAKVVIEIAEQMGFLPIVWDQDVTKDNILDYPVNHDFNALSEIYPVFLAMGSNHSRKENSKYTSNNSCNLVHPNAVLSKRINIGKGNVIMANAVINSSATIQNHCIINTSASIDHDVFIEDYVHVSPNASIAGGVYISEGAHIGIGACIRQNIKIGKWSVVGAGAVVVKDVPDYSVVVGNPAKQLIK